MRETFQTAKGLERRVLLARALSQVANASISEAFTFAKSSAEQSSWRIGVTGPAGSGKSSMIAGLAALRAKFYPEATEVGDEKLAILAIDPSSPLGHGALLGDRVRMDALVADPRVYVRSVASRGSLEGLAHNISAMLAVADAYGFQEIVLETVGLGQSECAVRALVDCLVLVLHPHAGDSIQAMKAGLLELADIYVVNKADLSGAAQTAAEIRGVLRARGSQSSWHAPVIEVSKNATGGLEALSGAIDAHCAVIRKERDPAEVVAQRRRYQLRSLLQRSIDEYLATDPDILEADLTCIAEKLLPR